MFGMCGGECDIEKLGVGIYAGVQFMNGGDGVRNVKTIIFSGVLGAVFFFSGIGLIRNTKDKAT